MFIYYTPSALGAPKQRQTNNLLSAFDLLAVLIVCFVVWKSRDDGGRTKFSTTVVAHHHRPARDADKFRPASLSRSIQYDIPVPNPKPNPRARYQGACRPRARFQGACQPRSISKGARRARRGTTYCSFNVPRGTMGARLL